MQIRVILVGTEGEANLGMVARLIDNFCADELYLVKPRVEVGEEALRYAVKAVDTLENAVVVESLEEALEGTDLSFCSTAIRREGDVLRETLELEDVVEILSKTNASKVGLVFGRESTGLTRSELALCDYRFTILTCDKYPTLNIANSVGITLYEVSKSRLSNIPRGTGVNLGQRRILVELLSELASHVFRDDHRMKDARIAAAKLGDPRFLSDHEVAILLTLVSRVKGLVERCRRSETAING